MTEPSLLVFAAATLALMLLPGPNVALIVGTSLTHGVRAGLLTVLGTSLAMTVQLGLTVGGMAALLAAASTALDWLRWIGVAYLLWLGLRQWQAPPAGTAAAAPGRRRILGRAALVALTNPKTLLFWGAFLPQFVRPDRPAGPQLVVLAALVLAIALVVDSGWAVLGGRARFLLRGRGRLGQRLSAGVLLSAAVGLAVAHRR